MNHKDHRAIEAAVARCAMLTAQLLTGEVLVGLMGSLGRYDFVLTTDDGQELVVAKHAVAYWVVEAQETQEVSV